MTKSRLKDGIVIEVRKGDRYILINEIFFNCNNLSHMKLNYYEEDLTSYVIEPSFDIVKVYNSLALCLSDYFKDKYLELIWESK